MSSSPNKASWLAKWLPLVVSIGVNVYLIGFKLGAIETKIAAIEKHGNDSDIHMSLDKKLDIFVSRREYESRMTARDSQVAELRTIILKQSEKLDRIWEKIAGR